MTPGVTAVALLMILGISTGPPDSSRQGGTLQIIVADRSTGIPACRGSVVLHGYRGEDLRALQFQIRGGKGVRFTDASAGSAVEDVHSWFFGMTIASKQPHAKPDMEDTIRVVIFSKTPAGLSSSSDLELLRFTADSIANRTGSMRLLLQDVLGALANGDEAGVRAASGQKPDPPGSHAGRGHR